MHGLFGMLTVDVCRQTALECSLERTVGVGAFEWLLSRVATLVKPQFWGREKFLGAHCTVVVFLPIMYTPFVRRHVVYSNFLATHIACPPAGPVCMTLYTLQQTHAECMWVCVNMCMCDIIGHGERDRQTVDRTASQPTTHTYRQYLMETVCAGPMTYFWPTFFRAWL